MNIVNCELFDLFHFSTIHSFCCKYHEKIPHAIDTWYTINKIHSNSAVYEISQKPLQSYLFSFETAS